MKPPEVKNLTENKNHTNITITDSSTLEDLINKYSQLDPTLVSDIFHGAGGKNATTSNFLLKEFAFEQCAPQPAPTRVVIEEPFDGELQTGNQKVGKMESTKSQSSGSPPQLSKNVSDNRSGTLATD